MPGIKEERKKFKRIPLYRINNILSLKQKGMISYDR